MLNIQQLNLVTRDTLLYGANMVLKEGTVYGLSARNGSGKTTLLRTISGLRSEVQGSISLQGMDTLSIPSIKMQLFYYETVEWFDLHLSGLDYLKFVCSTWTNQRGNAIQDVITFWGMEDYIKIPIKKYSLGMKQKVLLAMYGVSGAGYWLLDEPTIGLDTASLTLFETFILDAKMNGTCIIFSSHHNDRMYDICDYVYEMKDQSIHLVERNGGIEY